VGGFLFFFLQNVFCFFNPDIPSKPADFEKSRNSSVFGSYPVLCKKCLNGSWVRAGGARQSAPLGGNSGSKIPPHCRAPLFSFWVSVHPALSILTFWPVNRDVEGEANEHKFAAEHLAAAAEASRDEARDSEKEKMAQ